MITITQPHGAGVLLPESTLDSGWFTLLATFVAVNTMIYVVLALIKMLPKVNVGRLLRRGRYRRTETRHIDPNHSA